MSIIDNDEYIGFIASMIADNISTIIEMDGMDLSESQKSKVKNEVLDEVSFIVSGYTNKLIEHFGSIDTNMMDALIRKTINYLERYRDERGVDISDDILSYVSKIVKLMVIAG